MTNPVDKNGCVLKPLDLVIIDEIPSFHYTEEGVEDLEEYIGKYGLITYFGEDLLFAGLKDHSGWVNRDGSEVLVISHKCGKSAIDSWDFWLPTKGLRKIPSNSLILNIFCEYPWQLSDTNGSMMRYVTAEMEQYDYIKKILETPYDKLVAAHEAAMTAISSKD